jgi:murein DD-endopeptidase MepM/ murein hydrolase activator NlpD
MRPLRCRRLALLGASSWLAACAHYQHGTGTYHGAGDFKTPADYSTPSNPAPPVASNPPKDYSPKREFKLFWPVGNVRVNRGFAEKERRRGKVHQGVDLGGPMGAPILAAHEGVVVYAGRDFRGFGNMVLIEYDKEWATLYGHLSRIEVKEGRIVLPGDEIGKMGKTGRASGVHLHFELMHKRQPVDPLRYLTHAGDVAGR